MNKGILWIIKIIIILVVLVLMTLGKEAGIPIIVKNIIGFTVIYAVWKYKPSDESNLDNDDHTLDKF